MKLEFEYGSRLITFYLIYIKRKTMSIEVETTGEVTVIAPVGTYTDDVIEKVKSRAGWIVSKQYESKFINDTKIKREAVSGESYMYLGRNYSLDIRVDENIDNIEERLNEYKNYNSSIETILVPQTKELAHFEHPEKIAELVKTYFC